MGRPAKCPHSMCLRFEITFDAVLPQVTARLTKHAKIIDFLSNSIFMALCDDYNDTHVACRGGAPEMSVPGTAEGPCTSSIAAETKSSGKSLRLVPAQPP